MQLTAIKATGKRRRGRQSDFNETGSNQVHVSRRGDLVQVRKMREECPTLSKCAPGLSRTSLFKFLKVMNHEAKLTVECNVISYIYLARYIVVSGTLLTRENWRPLLTTSLMLASKVWDDMSMVNKDFSIILEWLDIRAINTYEIQFLKALHFDVNVQASHYAQIYFELHDRCCTNTSTGLTTKPLTVSAARILSINAENTVPAAGFVKLPAAEARLAKARVLPRMGQRGVAVLA
jgi:hypothetical protein